MQDNLSVEIRKPFLTNTSNSADSEDKFIYSTGRPILPCVNTHEAGNVHSVISCGSYAPVSSLDSFDVLKHSLISSSSYKFREPDYPAHEDAGSSSKLSGK